MNSENKLAILKEVRQKSFLLERRKQELQTHLTNAVAEEKCLAEFMTELRTIEKHKLARLEEIRQLDNDLACVQVLVEQSKQARDNSYSGACDSYDQFCSVKTHVDTLRSECLGLEKSDDLGEDVRNMMAELGVGRQDSEQVASFHNT